LIALIISITAGMIIVMNFLIDYLNYPLLFFIVWLMLILFLTFLWYLDRSVFPKGTKDKTNIVIAITTENESQKVRIKKDTANEIRKLLTSNNLDHQYDVIVLHNYLSQKLIRIIRLYSEARKMGLKKSPEINAFDKMSNKLNARFFVYGDLIKRDSPNGKYYLSIEALIKHTPTNSNNSKILHNEFNQLWNNEIKILEDDELNGFRSNAENIFLTSSYMFGLATFVDNQFLQGIAIWERLEVYIKEKKGLGEQLSKIIKLKSAAYVLQSRLDYYNGNIERSLEFREKLLEITPNDYSSHLIQAIKQVKINNRPEIAMEYIERAKSLSKNDGTWKYSLLYLEIRLGKHRDALNTLSDIIISTFEHELEVVRQVIAYNSSCLAEDESHIQTHFIIGVLMFKKLDNITTAYAQLEEFVNVTINDEKWKLLNEKAKEYIDKINPILEIEK
jgi:tetratricopeptide (TPR) repeat protein